jgi:hypothetical protein
VSCGVIYRRPDLDNQENKMTTGILINAVFFFVMGICSLIKPSSIISIVGLVPQNADARNEVRAVYGGFGVAISVLLIIAAYDERIRMGVLLAVAVSLMGMAFGRIISLFIEKPGFWPIFTLFIEAGLASLLLISIDG